MRRSNVPPGALPSPSLLGVQRLGIAASYFLAAKLGLHMVGEFAALVGCTVLASLAVFSDWLPESVDQSVAYIIFPLLIWGALRFQQPGATAVSLTVAAVAIVDTVAGLGPFAQPTVGTSLVLLLVFLGVVGLTGLVLGAMTAERRLVERERIELLARELQARAAAEEAVRQKDELVATVSHDLRTPLDAMLGWTVMLRQGMLSSERAAQALETIERNARAQAQLIDDLLDMSRIMAGRLLLHPAPTDVKQLIESVEESLKPAAQAKEVAVDVSVDPIRITADAARLQQIVWNLLSNAIKFTPKGGRVRIGAHRVADQAVISVRDNGVGIDPTFVPNLFQRFRQADRGSVAERGGLGLGLAIVRQLTELHGGTVSAASDGEGKGAEFVVTIPIAVASDPRERLVAPVPTGGS
ncbi:MAG: HAMP domain-containing histidine kinase [Acidobacteria bacterium]|nr:HAMP domain-containing histidine kinase [Acidobacteriota bacterium]